MSWSLADARFQFRRASGLLRRGLASLRTRGLRPTWERLKAQFRTVPAARADALVFPSTAGAPSSVPFSARPDASIVIPVFNQIAMTTRCLRAISEHPPACSVEIIVVDDGSSDDTARILPGIDGLRYLRRASNGGFVATCNDGAAAANGRHLVFLNNDTVPQPGWLDALLRTFAETPGAGLVGAQLRYPDGRLQEAGGIVFSDGSGWNYGRFEDPDDPRFSYLRDTDYASGAAIAIPRELFIAVGRFDERYSPAYYEDTDLAFKVRAAGKRVLYQPLSVVVHEEGATAGTDTSAGIKSYQVRNRERFSERHAQALATHATPGETPSPAFLHRHQPQVLFVDALTPTPHHDSGSLRMLNLMGLLQAEGAHVVFLPSDRKYAFADTQRLQSMGVECWHAPFVSTIPAWLREHGRRFDTVVLCRHYVAREFLPLARMYAPQARIVFDTIDLHYLREQRGAALSDDPSLARTARETRRLELDVIARSDTTVVVSESEKALLRTDAPDADVEVISNLHQVAGPGLPYAERRDLLFVGGFRHPPNVDAVRWFVLDVFPKVRQRLPGVTFHCVGGHVPPAVAELGQQPGVVVHGHLPDIVPRMEGCRIALAPLRFGAGVKGKVNLSMAHGQPVVATSVAVEGMHLTDGMDVLVADGADAFAGAIVRLHEDEALWQRLSRHGMENVSRHFSIDSARQTARRVFLPPDA